MLLALLKSAGGLNACRGACKEQQQHLQTTHVSPASTSVVPYAGNRTMHVTASACHQALHNTLTLALLLCAGCVQAKLANHDLNAALPIVLLLGSISQQQPALLSEYLPQLEECLGSFAGGWYCFVLQFEYYWWHHTCATSQHSDPTTCQQ